MRSGSRLRAHSWLVGGSLVAVVAMPFGVACRRTPPAEPSPDAAAPLGAQRAIADAGAAAVVDAAPLAIEPLDAAFEEDETSAKAVKRSSGDLFALPDVGGDASAPSVSARCAALETGERAFFARVARSFPGPSKPPCRFDPPRIFGTCSMHGNEAWALAFEELEVTWEKRVQGYPSEVGQCDMRGRWAVAHVDAAGVVTRISPRVFRDPGARLNFDVSFWTSENSGEVELAPLFDFDGDGSVEVRVTAAFHAHEAEPVGWDGILAHRAGRIALYEPALRFRDPARPRGAWTSEGQVSDCATRDADGDGRLDIVFRPYRKAVPTVFGFTLDEAEDVPFLAHSLPSGQFAIGDDAARRFAFAICPEHPKAIVTRADAGMSLTLTAHNVVCARVWGDSAGTVLGALGKACASYVPESIGEPLAAGQCVDWLADYARATPPVSLAPSADAGGR